MNWSDFLYYKDGKLFWSDPHCTRLKPGDEAGSRHHRGYWYVSRYHKSTSRHRIVWEMHNGEIPEGMEIDHINHIVGDDRIENLRMVTRRQNNQNKSKPSHNTSGESGVVWDKDRCKWRSQIGLRDENNKRKNKYVYYGDSFDDAVAAIRKARKENGFHDGHGE